MSNILSNNVVLISLLLVWCVNVLDLYVLIRSGAIQKCSLDKLDFLQIKQPVQNVALVNFNCTWRKDGKLGH